MIRQTARDVLLTYPPAGMAHELVIADRRLPPPIVGRPYEARLKALNAQGACAWSISNGKLPEGLAISAEGVITGKIAASGGFAFRLKVADAKGSAERDLTLRATEDRPPVIGETPLKPMALDDYCVVPITVEGGVGALNWAVAEGKLPFGIQLSEGGVLLGTPGEPGEFGFTIRATDSHPDGGRSATRDFTWSIGPASPETLRVRSVRLPAGTKASAAIKIDGKLDEPFWSLDQPIARPVEGHPAAKAAFDAFWLDGSKGRAESLYVAVRVTDGPGGKTPRDAVHLFLDGRHNREVVYNAGDLHIVIPRRGRPGFVRSHTPWWFTQIAVAEAPGGCVVEIRLGPANFQGKGIAVPFGARAVYGFDLAVDEGDAELRQQVWRGTAWNADDTSGFGSIVLTATPVTR